jgi:hypothetical protein
VRAAPPEMVARRVPRRHPAAGLDRAQPRGRPHRERRRGGALGLLLLLLLDWVGVWLTALLLGLLHRGGPILLLLLAGRLHRRGRAAAGAACAAGGQDLEGVPRR